MSSGVSTDRDWTVDPATHRTNSSATFVELSEEVGRLIRDSSHALLQGRADQVGRLIMAQLAHKHGLSPAKDRTS